VAHRGQSSQLFAVTKRYVERKVERDRESMMLTAIGCGSFLGAEGSPVSYNILEWSPQSQRWAASFWQSVNGGAFREIVASVSPEHVNQVDVRLPSVASG